jgi:hypothetical protein
VISSVQDTVGVNHMRVSKRLGKDSVEDWTHKADAYDGKGTAEIFAWNQWQVCGQTPAYSRLPFPILTEAARKRRLVHLLVLQTEHSIVRTPIAPGPGRGNGTHAVTS